MSARKPRGSNVRRERLASPVALTLAGTAFAVAFALLAPSRDAFTVDPADASLDENASPDQVRLAYLKARAAAGELGVEEAYASASALAREGRIAEARALLDAASSLPFGAAERLMLDIELAAGAVRRTETGAAVDVRDTGDRSGAPELGASVAAPTAAGAEPPDEPVAGPGSEVDADAARDRLVRSLRTLLDRPALHDRARLARASTLAAAWADPGLAAAFDVRLADIDPERAVEYLARCARRLGGSGDRPGAVSCLERGRALAVDPAERFSLGLELVRQLPAADSGGRRRALVDESLAYRTADADELEALATTALAIERPDAAARAYARLAEIDTDRRSRWLDAAARWSEAAGKPAEAAVFIDALPQAATPEERDARERRVRSLLIGAGRTAAALERVAERIAAAPEDAEAVRAGVETARQAGDVGRALGWNTAYLAAHPDDVEALRRQVPLALALGRPDLALAAAERTRLATPDDPALLGELARLAEWAGDPERALVHRRRLATEASDADNLTEIVRLAEAVRRPAVAADALMKLALDTEPDEADVRRLVNLYELDGRPDAAAAALETIMKRHGERAPTLRALAELQARHVNHRPALDAWRRLATRFGRTADETLARVELHWRLDEPDAAAALAAELPSLGFGGEASEYQTRLLAEIGWQYRLPEVTALARPLLASQEDLDLQLLHGRRAIEAFESVGARANAIEEAETLWRSSGSAEFGLMALRIAIDGNDAVATERLFADAARDESLVALADYWSLRAVEALRRDDADAARRAYETALGIDADDIGAVAGLLWLHIGEGDTAALAALLDDWTVRAAELPELWAVFAVGHVELGDAPGSLPWFERAIGDTGSERRGDYGLILTWADALEMAGRVDHARRVRRFAVAQLRPELIEASATDRDALLRQYGGVLARYGSSEANEAWMRYVLNGDTGVGSKVGSGAPDAALWREDMAISWLMATERHEHARLLMARRHERRLATPVWQDLALAMRADDTESVQAMLDAGTGLSAGDRIVALRRLGRDADAWTLALRTLDNPRTPGDRDVARSQYVAMKRFRPSDATAVGRLVTVGDLDVEEGGFALRHTFGASAIGVGVDYTRHRFDSERLAVEDGERSSVALSLFREGVVQGFGITAGMTDDGRENRLFGELRYARRDREGRREAALEVAWNETADESAELRLAGVRDRVTLSVESAVGERAFARLSAEADEIRTRVEDRRLARGLGARAELGLRGGFGTIAWSGSVVAAGARNDRVERLPEELRLAGATSLDAVLPERESSLSLNGSLSRGGVGGDFLDVASPRWYLNGGIGHVWPEQSFGLELDAGVGVRVIGDDELALAFGRGARLAGRRTRADLTTFSMTYRYRF